MSQRWTVVICQNTWNWIFHLLLISKSIPIEMPHLVISICEVGYFKNAIRAFSTDWSYIGTEDLKLIDVYKLGSWSIALCVLNINFKNLVIQNYISLYWNPIRIQYVNFKSSATINDVKCPFILTGGQKKQKGSFSFH